MWHTERIERVKKAMEKADLDAVVCSLPSNVLMLTGYFPVVGTSLTIFSRGGQICLIAPQDEEKFTGRSWAGEIKHFKPGALKEITNAVESVKQPLEQALKDMRLKRKRIGYENGAFFQPSSYASMHFFGGSLVDLLKESELNLISADEMLKQLRAVKTPYEIERIRTACCIAERGYKTGKEKLKAGLTERETAANFEKPLGVLSENEQNVARVEGFAFCASGKNSAKANAAYQRSGETKLKENEFILIHCNSHADGYWTDITRTYILDEPDEKKRQIYEAVFEARKATLAAIRPGVKAADVDKAGREVIKEYGFGDYFTHGTGHEVGFAAIDHNAKPRIHPASDEILETGMTFNVEPAIYIKETGGLRHCDMVAVTETGCKLLTPFHSSVEDLIIKNNNDKKR